MQNSGSFLILLYLILLFPLSLGAQTVEICDNALDDDGNGLIDLNDPACICEPPDPASQIPNPSFEDITCCPSGNSQLYCADTWIQASEATTDYYHRCNYFIRDQFPVPQPIPDGDAYIGFRNGRFGQSPNPNWKEYTGACLLSPLLAGNTYTFKFNIGFLGPIVSPPMRVVFYGTTDCENLPFGVGDSEFGCPLNGSGWRVLGQVWANGINTWMQYEISTTPNENITAIAIGPDCLELERDSNTYYFLDNLILADSRLFGPSISESGHSCSPDFTLLASEKDQATYQWYRNGIALVGETNRALQLKRTEGLYQVITRIDSICLLSDEYQYRVPHFSYTADLSICPGSSLAFGNQQLSSPGIYLDTFSNKDGCDSAVLLSLSLAQDLQDTVETYIFEGDAFRVGPYSYNKATETAVNLVSELGCDSTVFLNLREYSLYIPNVFSPNGDGVNDSFKLYGDQSLYQIASFRIFDRWGNLLFQQKTGADFEWKGNSINGILEEGVYLYMVELILHDQSRKILSGDIMLLR